MTRIIIICEGPTEREFCEEVLYPYFFTRGIVIQAPLIMSSGGGIVKWAAFSKQINLHLKSDPTAYVTTFIDLYGLRAKHDFPSFVAIGEQSSSERISALEQGMLDTLPNAYWYRFIPYVQQHEFEALVFADVNVIKRNFSGELSDEPELDRIAADYPNPEDINDSYETAPSKRLQRILPAYNKVVYGSLITGEIGMDRLLDRCPHFRDWIERLGACGEEKSIR